MCDAEVIHCCNGVSWRRYIERPRPDGPQHTLRKVKNRVNQRCVLVPEVTKRIPLSTSQKYSVVALCIVCSARRTRRSKSRNNTLAPWQMHMMMILETFLLSLVMVEETGYRSVACVILVLPTPTLRDRIMNVLLGYPMLMCIPVVSCTVGWWRSKYQASCGPRCCSSCWQRDTSMFFSSSFSYYCWWSNHTNVIQFDINATK